MAHRFVSTLVLSACTVAFAHREDWNRSVVPAQPAAVSPPPGEWLGTKTVIAAKDLARRFGARDKILATTAASTLEEAAKSINLQD